MLQKRVIRLVHFLPYRDHSLPFFVSSNILPIELLYFDLELSCGILCATKLFTLYSAVVSAAQARPDVCSTCSTLLYVVVLLNLRVNEVFPLCWRDGSA